MKEGWPPLNADLDTAEKEKETKDKEHSEQLPSDEDGHISPTFAPLSPVEYADEPGTTLKKILLYSLDCIYAHNPSDIMPRKHY